MFDAKHEIKRALGGGGPYAAAWNAKALSRRCLYSSLHNSSAENRADNRVRTEPPPLKNPGKVVPQLFGRQAHRIVFC